MAIKLGNTDINKIYLGNIEINKAYLGNILVFDNSNQGVELLTELNAAALDNEGNSTGSWNNTFNLDIETIDTNGSSFALRVQRTAESVISSILTISNGIVVGDTLVYSFDIKTNTQTGQSVTLQGTDDNSGFWSNGQQPLTYTNYTRQVVATSTTVGIRLNAYIPGTGASSDNIMIDNLSIINLGQ